MSALATLPPVIPDAPLTHLDKDYVETFENEKVPDEDAAAVPVSAYDHLSFKQTIRTFPKATLCCLLALFIASSDGFQFSLPGNLVAQTSFISERTRLTRSDPRSIRHGADGDWRGCLECAICLGMGRDLQRRLHRLAACRWLVRALRSGAPELISARRIGLVDDSTWLFSRSSWRSRVW